MNIEEITHQLVHTGYIVLDNPLPTDLTEKLFSRCHDDGEIQFCEAQIGRGSAKQLSHSIRGDLISWLDDTDSVDAAYLAWMEKLRIGLNERLFLGLFEFECHYAIYNNGAGYAKHSDVLNGNRNRIVSTVIYLNKNRLSTDGGELVLYDPTGQTVIDTVIPTYGSIILFLSELVPHEVLISHTTRRSIAGWFRVRS